LRVYTLNGQEDSSWLLSCVQLNGQDGFHWPLRVYSLDGQEESSWPLRCTLLQPRSKLPVVESLPQRPGGVLPGAVVGIFWLIDPQTLVFLGGLNSKPTRDFYFSRESTPKPVKGFGGLTPIFWGIWGLGVGSLVFGSCLTKPLHLLSFLLQFTFFIFYLWAILKLLKKSAVTVIFLVNFKNQFLILLFSESSIMISNCWVGVM
jgi:hypothetical protein